MTQGRGRSDTSTITLVDDGIVELFLLLFSSDRLIRFDSNIKSDMVIIDTRKRTIWYINNPIGRWWDCRIVVVVVVIGLIDTIWFKIKETMALETYKENSVSSCRRLWHKNFATKKEIIPQHYNKKVKWIRRLPPLPTTTNLLLLSSSDRSIRFDSNIKSGVIIIDTRKRTIWYINNPIGRWWDCPIVAVVVIIGLIDTIRFKF